MADSEIAEAVQSYTQQVIEMTDAVFGVRLDFDRPSLEWVSNYIEQERQNNLPYEIWNGLVSNFGAFLGECIRLRYGGEWIEVENEWALQINPDVICFPFTKVAKQFQSGTSESILALYDSVPLLGK